MGLAVGDRLRFTVGRRDGMVRDAGPGEDFESEPNEYEPSVRAPVPHGAAVEVRVVATIVNVNEPPEAEDDEAATDEDHESAGAPNSWRQSRQRSLRWR